MVHFLPSQPYREHAANVFLSYDIEIKRYLDINFHLTSYLSSDGEHSCWCKSHELMDEPNEPSVSFSQIIRFLDS